MGYQLFWVWFICLMFPCYSGRCKQQVMVAVMDWGALAELHGARDKMLGCVETRGGNWGLQVRAEVPWQSGVRRAWGWMGGRLLEFGMGVPFSWVGGARQRITHHPFLLLSTSLSAERRLTPSAEGQDPGAALSARRRERGDRASSSSPAVPASPCASFFSFPLLLAQRLREAKQQQMAPYSSLTPWCHYSC